MSEFGSERIIRYAFEYARDNGRKRVHCVTKSNIMKYTDGLFLSVFREVAKEYPEIEPWENLVDATCMGLIQRPEEWDVLVLPNLYGDILSDLTAGMVGGLGVAPGANIGTKAAVFEATHGSAPKYKGQNKVNPTAMILSGEMMLRHVGETAAADNLERAVSEVIAEGNERRPTTSSRTATTRPLSAPASTPTRSSRSSKGCTPDSHGQDSHRRRRRFLRLDHRAAARGVRHLRHGVPDRHRRGQARGPRARHQPVAADRGLRDQGRRRHHRRSTARATSRPPAPTSSSSPPACRASRA